MYVKEKDSGLRRFRYAIIQFQADNIVDVLLIN